VIPRPPAALYSSLHLMFPGHSLCATAAHHPGSRRTRQADGHKSHHIQRRQLTWHKPLKNPPHQI
jgi:hypothetical protein